MNCQELTDSISNIKLQMSKFDIAVNDRKPEEAIEIKKAIEEIFNGELKEYIDTFYKSPTPENYDKEVNRIIKIIGSRDPSKVVFSRRQLIFIYDMDDTAKYSDFNRESVKKIEMIREQRMSKQKEDASIIFNLSPDQIACADDIINPNTPKEDTDTILKECITSDTRLYIGPLFPGIFYLPNLEHIYSSFSEGEIKRDELTIGGKTEQELGEELEKNGHRISGYVEGMLDEIYQSEKFKKHQENPEQINTIILKVRDLGFPKGATMQEIYDTAEKYGLELCPPEVGPYQRLQDRDQPMENYYWIAMKQITAYRGEPSVFCLGHHAVSLWLDSDLYDPDQWGPDARFLFGLRPKPEQSSV